jgi:hypothetical protein
LKLKIGENLVEMANSRKRVIYSNELLKGMETLPRFS